MQFYEQDSGLKYPSLGSSETKIRRIGGVSVIQRHDWSIIRYREIKSSIEGRPINYARSGRQIELAI